MRAVVMHEFGDADVLRLEDVPAPSPGPGQVLVRVAAVEVSRTRDVATRTGKHPFSQFVTLPHILGGDFGGEVVEAGEGVDPGLIGKRVAVSNTETCGECEECRSGHEERCAHLSLLGIHRRGSYAEYAVIGAGNCPPGPRRPLAVEAAALAADGSIAFTQLQVAGVGPGTKLLVTGVSGALGSTLAALGSYLGADVIGLSRRPDTVPDALGLHANLDATDPDLTAALMAATDGAGHRRGRRQRRQPRRLRRLLPGARGRRPGRLLRGDRQPRAADPAGPGRPRSTSKASRCSASAPPPRPTAAGSTSWSTTASASRPGRSRSCRSSRRSRRTSGSPAAASAATPSSRSGRERGALRPGDRRLRADRDDAGGAARPRRPQRRRPRALPRPLQPAARRLLRRRDHADVPEARRHRGGAARARSSSATTSGSTARARRWSRSNTTTPPPAAGRSST